MPLSNSFVSSVTAAMIRPCDTSRMKVYAGIVALILGVSACSGDAPAPGAPIPPPRDSTPTLGGLARWSDAATWPSLRVPTAGESVTIATGKRVLLDVDPPALSRLTVAGELTVPDAGRRLTVARLDVRGTFIAGTETAPLSTAFTLTLAGADSTATDFIGLNALAVYAGGRLELHGAPREDWVRLDRTIAAGATTIQVDRPVSWRAGDHLVLAPSGVDPTEAEEVVVASVSGDKKSLTLDRPIRAAHWGVQQIIDGRSLDERAEVGLLTRPIVIQGDPDADRNGQGGHILIGAGGIAHVEGVELLRMGQRGVLAHYAVHWHMAGDVTGQYARHNSVVHSYNRCLTIHGTNSLDVRGNVCYDFAGHGFFLEDGSETGNTLVGNLAVGGSIPLPAMRLLPTDDRPASFWVTNPANTLQENVAAGTFGFGFWYALPLHPTGPSATTAIWPRSTPLTSFDRNVAHSNVQGALFVDDGPNASLASETTNYSPQSSPTDGASPVVAHFTRFLAYQHPERAIWLRGAYLNLDDAILADNGIGATFAAYNSRVTRGWFVGRSASGSTSPAPDNWVRGFEFYDGPITVDGALFSNYQPANGIRASALAFHTPNGFSLHPLNTARALTFSNAALVWLAPSTPGLDGEQTGIIRDADGSLTGRVNGVVVPDTTFMRDASCVRRADWNAAICTNGYAGVSLTGQPGERVAPLTVTRDDGASVALAGVPDAPTEVDFNARLARTFTITAPTPLRHPRVSISPLGQGEVLTLVFPASGPPTAATVEDGVTGTRPLSFVTSSSALVSQLETASWFDPTTGRLSIRVVGTATGVIYLALDLP